MFQGPEGGYDGKWGGSDMGAGILPYTGGPWLLPGGNAGGGGLWEFSRLIREALSSEKLGSLTEEFTASIIPALSKPCLVNKSVSAFLTPSVANDDADIALVVVALSPAYTACALKLSAGRPKQKKYKYITSLIYINWLKY